MQTLSVPRKGGDNQNRRWAETPEAPGITGGEMQRGPGPGGEERAL